MPGHVRWSSGSTLRLRKPHLPLPPPERRKAARGSCLGTSLQRPVDGTYPSMISSSTASSSLRQLAHQELLTTIPAYGIRISNPDLPVVNVGNIDYPTYLPLQVCYILPGQPAKTKLDQTQTQHMIRFAVRRPVENATSIVTKGLQTAGLSPITNPQLASHASSPL